MVLSDRRAVTTGGEQLGSLLYINIFSVSIPIYDKINKNNINNYKSTFINNCYFSKMAKQ